MKPRERAVGAAGSPSADRRRDGDSNNGFFENVRYARDGKKRLDIVRSTYR
jgi:hypothetical protein